MSRLSAVVIQLQSTSRTDSSTNRRIQNHKRQACHSITYSQYSLLHDIQSAC